MNEFFEQYVNFYYASVFLFLFMGVGFTLKALFTKKPNKDKASLSFNKLNDRFERELQNLLKLSKPPKKKRSKDAKASEAPTKSKKQKAQIKKSREHHVYVLNFVGDVMAHATKHLREEISLLLQVATPNDEIVVRLSSPGGSVAQYGLASSQLARVRQAGIPLTVCVDLVAASGGYMMACVADKIVAAPFAIVGSIGVVAGVPNFHKALQKHDVDYLQFTAGKYKRTITALGEVTEEGKEKFQETLGDIHEAFKGHLEQYRPALDVEAISTGEYWLATQAQEKKLVDEIMTSDDYLASKMDKHHVIEVKTEDHKGWMEKWLKKGALSLGLPWNIS